MTANTARQPGPFKEGYEGDRPETRLTPRETPAFEKARDALVARLHDAMLVLSVLDAHNPAGKGSSWPQYVHDWGDKIAQAENPEDQAPRRFDPTRAQVDDFLPAMGLIEGLRTPWQRVLFMRAFSQWLSPNGKPWSFDIIGEDLGRSGEWARAAYEAVLIQAARRSGLLTATPRGWAVMVGAVNYGGWRSFLTTANDPATQLRDLRAKSPVAIDQAFFFWTAGQAVAKRLAKTVRTALKHRTSHGSWFLLHPDDMADWLVQIASEIGAGWEIEATKPSREGGPRVAALKAAMRAPDDATVVRIIAGDPIG